MDTPIAATLKEAKPNKDKAHHPDDVALEEGVRRAAAEREALLCGDARSRAVATQVLERHLATRMVVCPNGHQLVVAKEVRDIFCDGPLCGGRGGEEALALAYCEKCDAALCISCIAKVKITVTR